MSHAVLSVEINCGGEACSVTATDERRCRNIRSNQKPDIKSPN
jgi:hypothetical protein